MFVRALVLSTLSVALFVAPAAQAGTSSSASAAAPSGDHWDKLGEREVDGRADHDAIAVTSDDGKFKAIQLKVEKSSLIMFDVKVTFANGDVFSPSTRLIFDKGAESRVIDLPGGDRAIRKIEFKYSNIPGGGKARVEVHGRH